MLKRHHMDSPHPLLNVTYNQVVAEKANVFLSFAYTNNFCELVDALENHLQTTNSNTFFWFDVFVNNQWVAAEKSFEWWATTFRTAVCDIGETLLFLEPWDNPVMLTRAWCLYEISCSKNIFQKRAIELNLERRRNNPNSGIYYLGPETYFHAITEVLLGKQINRAPSYKNINVLLEIIKQSKYLKTFREEPLYKTLLYQGSNIHNDKDKMYNDEFVNHWSKNE
jgi:hypothetical protein